MPSHHRAKTVIDGVLSFVKAGSLSGDSSPGFAHALRLSYNTVSKERYSADVEKKTLTYAYRFADGNKPSVGLLSALQDELGTQAMFGAGLPCPPGASIQMRTELVDKKTPIETNRGIDVVNTVTKLGKTISHTRTNFYYSDGDDNNNKNENKNPRLRQREQRRTPIACSTHVKYMPTGSRIIDWLMTSKWMWTLFRYFLLDRQEPSHYEEKPLVAKDVIGTHLEFQGLGKASFHPTEEHTNPMGAMHGGCVAMVMERVAEPYAKHALGVDSVVLESMNVEFLGAVGLGGGKKHNAVVVDVECETIAMKGGDESNNNVLIVNVLQRRGTRIVSDAILKFSPQQS